MTDLLLSEELGSASNHMAKRWELSPVFSMFLLLSVRSTGSSVPCYNGTCGYTEENASSVGSLELIGCGVPSDNASCSRRSVDEGATNLINGNTCEDQRHEESCNIKAGTDVTGSTLMTGCQENWVANLQHKLLYGSKYSYTVYLTWNPHPTTYPRGDPTFAKLDVKVKEVVTCHQWLFFYISEQVIPEGSCAAAKVHVPVPTDCLHLCPTMCSCINEYRFELYPPTNVTTCVSTTDGGTVTLKIAWNKTELYYMNTPYQTFYLTISNETSAVLMDTIQVKGETSVYLRLMGVTMTKSYFVQVTEVICEHQLKSEKKTRISFHQCHPQTPTQANPTGTFRTTTGDTPTSATAYEDPPTVNRTSVRPNLTVLPVHSSRNATSLPLTIYTTSALATPTKTTPAKTTFGSPVSDGSSKMYLLVAITMPISIVTVAITALLVSAMFILKKYRSRDKLQDKTIIQPIKADRAEKTVLVLFSQASSMKDELSVMEHVVKALSIYGIHCLYFDKPTVRTSVADWVEVGIKRSDNVLLVVNKEFVKEWDSPKAYIPHGESLIYITKHVIHNFIMRDRQRLSKFALVFLKKEDQHDLLKESLYLQSLKSYLILPQAKGELEGLVKFIMNMPTYVLSGRKT